MPHTSACTVTQAVMSYLLSVLLDLAGECILHNGRPAGCVRLQVHVLLTTLGPCGTRLLLADQM